MNSKIIAFIIPLLVLSGTLTGQHVPSDERGDPNFRRQTDIDGNKVRTSIFNFGLTGRTGALPGEIPYEWPINTGKHYIALTALFVGSEVITESGEVKPMVTVPLGREDDAGNSMKFEPVPEYLNLDSDRIAKSDEPETWPEVWPDKMTDEQDPGWPGSWNGFFGKNQFNADQEIYFKISDDRNFLKGFTYYPDATDSSRRGAGILSGVRVMEWSQILVEDVVFILYEIKNDGTKDLQNVSFSLWLADLVGGDGDSGDDTPDFDLIYDIAWSKDNDGIGNEAFGSDPVGVAASAYLETPGNAIDRIDNDGDGEPSDKKVTEAMVESELYFDGLDDNYNGLIDENEAHIPFADQEGVTYANRMDDNGNAESGSPVVTSEMVTAAASDVAGAHNQFQWRRWPPSPESDAFQKGQIHLIMVEETDIGKAFADGLDNDESEEYPIGQGADVGGPRVTQAMIDAAAQDNPYHRYRVPGTGIILYDLDSSDVGLRYADGIDNDGDGAVDEGIDDGIDEMVDESREDYIDNDFDWNPFQDDVGLDGDEDSPDIGQNNARPTSGTGTTLPGEPNIDKTDVSESDQMGLTSVTYDAAGTIPTRQDRTLWISYMMPGIFKLPPPGGLTGDFDLFVTSAFFPIAAGETNRISMAVCLGEDEADAQRNKDVAQKTYDEDYQFAKQPIPPHVKGIAGDGKVTLIWDDVAEGSFDSYMYGIGSPGYDFEGYKIYRATDPAFEDALDITDAQGNLTFYTPIVQYDAIDGIEGYHEVAVNGVHYWLGSETGLLHSYIDEDVINGQTYYYAVVSYDFGGDLTNLIPPTESNKRLVVSSLTGEIRKGPNVVIVTPNPAAAGYVEADLDTLILVEGTTSSRITYEIVDHFEVKDRHTYRVTFEDTLKPKIKPNDQDTLTTKHYTLVDVTNSLNPDTLIAANRHLESDYEQPIIDGFRLTFYNESFVMISWEKSHWQSQRSERDSLWQYVLEIYGDLARQGVRVPADYRIEFKEPGASTSTEFEQVFPVIGTKILPSIATNFVVKKRVGVTGVDEADWAVIPYGFGDISGGDSILNADARENDYVIFLDDTSKGPLGPTWVFKLKYPKLTERYIYQPTAGDTVFLILNKPFLSNDVLEFTTLASHIDTTQAKDVLKAITVVPNPYRVAVAWEPRNPYTTGRGPRAIHFRHLPAICTIRIFTVSGELVKVIEHDDVISNGTAIWDLLTKDNLAASYGVYVYHVDAPGIGQHIGKFAIIK
ncbi:MAG: hypothetical protein ACETWG_03635 [Candidatus Neomarinimicrobiota bacterium]